MKETFEEKGKKLADQKRNTETEVSGRYKSSVTYSLLTPNGFPVLFTMGNDSAGELLEEMEGIETFLKDAGYTADIKSRSGGRTGASKDIETVEGRSCPKCSSPLVYFTTKDGKKHIKCSTQKYDWNTKTTSGCDFVEWADDGGDLDSPSGDGATPKQQAILKEKNLWEEGMTKAQATELIGKVLGK